MGRLLDALSFPLLTRELFVQAARKRTWIVRSLCVLGLLWFFVEECAWRWPDDPLVLMGSGNRIFTDLIGFLFLGIYVIVPLGTFALISGEKERDSLMLLLVTRLHPWKIVFEKLLSQMVPAWLFILSALPLLAIAQP